MIAERIKEKMLKKGISAHALEKQAGLKSCAIHNILCGRSKNPSINIVKSIAFALECNIQELIEDDSTASLFDSQDITPTPTNKEGVQWNSKLYLDSFEIVHSILKEKKAIFEKKQILDMIDEVYLYSQKAELDRADIRFAQWIIDKNNNNK